MRPPNASTRRGPNCSVTSTTPKTQPPEEPLVPRSSGSFLDWKGLQLHDRFVEVMARPDRVEQARALGPIHERVLFGRHIFLYDGIASDRLAELGEIHKPGVADLFVALMSEPDSKEEAA